MADLVGKVKKTYNLGEKDNVVSGLYDATKNGNLLGGLTNNLSNGKVQSEINFETPDYLDLDLRKWFSQTVLDNKMAFRQYLVAEDPTFFGFKLYISPSDPLFLLPSDSNKETTNTNSAYNYLLNINQTKRAEMLKQFITRWKLLITERNHFLQKMSGLGNIYQIGEKSSFIERILSFSTLESIDTFISAMAHDYNNACYDYDNMKYVLPINLRYFNLMIIITEIRQFKTFIGNMETKPTDVYQDVDDMIWLNRHLGVHALSFTDCQFDFSESSDYLNNLDNSNPQVASNKFKIKLGKMKFNLTDLNIFSESEERKILNEGYIFPNHNPEELYGSDSLRRFSKPDIPTSPKKKFGEKIKDAIVEEGKKAIQNVADNLDDQLSNIVNIAESKITDAAGNLVNKYSPSNWVARKINNVTGKFTADVNNFLNDTIDNFTDKLSGSNKNSLGDKILNEYNSISQSSADNIRESSTKNAHILKNRTNLSDKITSQEIERYNSTISSSQIADEIIEDEIKLSPSEKLRKKVCDIILYGKSADQYIKDTVKDSIGKSIS